MTRDENTMVPEPPHLVVTPSDDTCEMSVIRKITRQPRLMRILASYLDMDAWENIAYITNIDKGSYLVNEDPERTERDNVVKLRGMIHLCVGDDAVSINERFDWVLMRMIKMLGNDVTRHGMSGNVRNVSSGGDRLMGIDGENWRYRSDEELRVILEWRPMDMRKSGVGLSVVLNDPVDMWTYVYRKKVVA